MFTVFFSKAPVIDTETALAADTKRFATFFHEMLNLGIFFPPSQFETTFIGARHSDEILDKTLAAAKIAFEKVK